MGTIQPSRFLSHTGKILPGVRRVFTNPEPAAGTNWSITVPAGVQWWVTAGFVPFTTDSVVGTRFVQVVLNVDGLNVWEAQAVAGQAASNGWAYNFTSTAAPQEATGDSNKAIICLPTGYLPSGATLMSAVASMDPGDQWGIGNWWIEEVYVTDPQLSEIARTRQELDREIAMYEYEQAEQAGGNT